MFIRFCFGSGCAGVSIAGLREIRAAHRVFLSPSHGTKKALKECNGEWVLKNSVFLKTSKIWRIENVQENRERRL
jgi:hypothetical protein